MDDRLTYKSPSGGYGLSSYADSDYEQVCILRDKLGKYEDLGYTPEQLKEFIKRATAPGA